MDIVYRKGFRIEPELKAVYVAPSLQTGESSHTEPQVKLLFALDDVKIHLFEGVCGDITVVHPVNDSPAKTSDPKKLRVEDHAEDMMWAQRRLHDAIGRLEDRLLQRNNSIM